MFSLVVKSLRCSRGGRILITDLSFALDAGDGLIVAGPNGAGKSTLLRALAGFHRADAGEIRVEGVEDGDDLGRHCAYVGHLNALKFSQTAEENLRFVAAYFGGRAGDVDAALAQFGLESVARIPAGYLSAGQKRRLSLCRLAIVRRPLWLLDEPTESLDAASSAAFEAAARRHRESGGLVVAATHAPFHIGAAYALDLGAEGFQMRRVAA
ncbi:MAG: heme ABC exporter ATP-binding protein CcmA [Hyphomicrobiales bacterium]|nr:heme ABC exporter ATP-binding protein CcmA [Hyphomicrobiales bacterium]